MNKKGTPVSPNSFNTIQPNKFAENTADQFSAQAPGNAQYQSGAYSHRAQGGEQLLHN